MPWLIVLSLLIVLLLVAGAIVAGVVLLAKSSKRTQQQAGVIPGVPVTVPPSWGLSHDPEARLHRRMAAAIASLDNTIGQADVNDLQARGQLMADATAIDNQLLAIWGLPREAKPAALAGIEPRVAALEAEATRLALAPGARGIDQASGALDGIGEVPRMPDLPTMPTPPTPAAPTREAPSQPAAPKANPEPEQPS